MAYTFIVKILISFTILSTCCGRYYLKNTHTDDGTNFRVSLRTDNFLETRLNVDGVLMIEKAVPDQGENYVFLRRVSDGRSLLELVYHHQGLLLHCDIYQDHPFHFEQFQDEFWLQTGSIRSDQFSDLDYYNTSIFAGHPNVTEYTQIWSSTDLSELEQEMLDLERLKTACLDLKQEIKHDFMMRDVVRAGTGGGWEESQRGGDGESRTRRSWLIYPSTKWCGSGTNAASYDELGNYTQLDSCCREHDSCDSYIPPWTTAYRYSNLGFSTVSHCDCDVRFYECLKGICGYERSAAEMVGHLFFNIMSKSCFVFRYQRVCTERSYWGWCTRYQTDYVAVDRDALTF